MQIIPAIDIKSGKCVCLLQGKFEQITEYSGHPWEVANNYFKQGAKHLHVVDLDGAKEGEAVQVSRIAQICELEGIDIQVGGGIRTHRHIKVLFADGASRVVIGSLAVTSPSLVKEWIAEFGPDRIVLAFDVKINEQGTPLVVMHGWQNEADKNLWELLDLYQDVSLKNVLCTDILRDGTMQGPNVALYQECLKRYPEISFQACGGIGSLDDLKVLQDMNIYGVIVGRALYEKRFTLEEALYKIDTAN
ncbi:MAG: 1-(5-phosphoribosyl)-5-[(5-phosphoribosylamino)methylideneamino]imidazole-4-carboxamide isomerase [Proteobacteria bacterium]|nr:1-(5-phosphoribosyl)-5-[(5-phosphoribosylamino)methylideneamino]imidazole-4-carboxamide isomerase [Pseudomonadota bacterium]